MVLAGRDHGVLTTTASAPLRLLTQLPSETSLLAAPAIIYGLYHEYGIEIPKNIAGLMLSAILSDTLAFRSHPLHRARYCCW